MGDRCLERWRFSRRLVGGGGVVGWRGFQRFRRGSRGGLAHAERSDLFFRQPQVGQRERLDLAGLDRFLQVLDLFERGWGWRRRRGGELLGRHIHLLGLALVAQRHIVEREQAEVFVLVDRDRRQRLGGRAGSFGLSALFQLGKDRPFLARGRLLARCREEPGLWLLGRLLPAKATGLREIAFLFGCAFEALFGSESRAAWLQRLFIERERLERRRQPADIGFFAAFGAQIQLVERKRLQIKRQIAGFEIRLVPGRCRLNRRRFGSGGCYWGARLRLIGRLLTQALQASDLLLGQPQVGQRERLHAQIVFRFGGGSIGAGRLGGRPGNRFQALQASDLLLGEPQIRQREGRHGGLLLGRFRRCSGWRRSGLAIEVLERERGHAEVGLGLGCWLWRTGRGRRLR